MLIGHSIRSPVSPLALSQGQGPAHRTGKEQFKATCLHPLNACRSLLPHSLTSGSLPGYCQLMVGKHQFKPQTLRVPMM